MKIAIVGAGRTGLGAARLLGEDPRHVTTVFETRERFGGRVGDLFRLGVTLRCQAQVERLAADEAGADLWINGRAERFDLVLVATSAADAQALLARSGVGRLPLRQRVYFAEHNPDAARSALVQLAADHPALRPLAARVVYIANQRWALDAVVVRAEPEPGASLAFVVEAGVAARAAALAAIAANAPIVPIAAPDQPHARLRVLIGEPFYPETSSIDELIGDMRAVIRHLERLAVARPAISRGRTARSTARPEAATTSVTAQRGAVLPTPPAGRPHRKTPASTEGPGSAAWQSSKYQFSPPQPLPRDLRNPPPLAPSVTAVFPPPRTALA